MHIRIETSRYKGLSVRKHYKKNDLLDYPIMFGKSKSLKVF